jgi:hypothetical protein
MPTLQSPHALRTAASQGPILISSVCYSELSGNFTTPDRFASLLSEMGIEVSLIGIEAAFLAGHFALDIGEGAAPEREFSLTFL